MSIERIHSTAEFANAMRDHKVSQEKFINSIEPNIADAALRAGERTRELFHLSNDDVVVIFGEQPYGLNEKSKVLGKRVAAKSLEQKHGVVPFELFATYDSVGSEPSIYRMRLPNPQSDNGFTSLNVLRGWKKNKHATTSSLRSPNEEELQALLGTVRSLYRGDRADSFGDYLTESYLTHPDSYGDAQIDILRRFETQIGLEIDKYATEDILDTAIAQNGGMELMLEIWPNLRNIAERVNTTTGVRIPDKNQAPFFLYNINEAGFVSRMHVDFLSSDFKLDSKMKATCITTGSEEILTPQDVIDQGRKITWRAIPRVIVYSSVGFADGHITGGGSVYDHTAHDALAEADIPFFPITWMDKKNQENGSKSSPFVYQSYANSRNSAKKLKGYEPSRVFVREGSAAMVDLALSVGVTNLKAAIEETLNNQVSVDTQVVVETEHANTGNVFIVNK